jgi:hypothetical protein
MRRKSLTGESLVGERATVCVLDKRNPEAIAPAHWLVPKVKLQVPPLRYPGFPVQEIQGSFSRDDKFEAGGSP